MKILLLLVAMVMLLVCGWLYVRALIIPNAREARQYLAQTTFLGYFALSVALSLERIESAGLLSAMKYMRMALLGAFIVQVLLEIVRRIAKPYAAEGSAENQRGA
jgi:hypothetical protein